MKFVPPKTVPPIGCPFLWYYLCLTWKVSESHKIFKIPSHSAMNWPLTSTKYLMKPHGKIKKSAAVRCYSLYYILIPKFDILAYDFSIETWSFFRGDRVQILNGRDKGKQGIINQIIEERNWVFVDGLNCKLSTYGKKDDFPGIVIKEEMPLLV